MGSASKVAGWTGVGLSLASSIMQHRLERSAAKVERFEAETFAAQEELAATQREGDRKARLSEALASQNAMAAAGGIAAFEGSPLAILDADISKEKQATERDVFQTKLKTESIRSGAKIREKVAKVGSNISLIGSVGQASMQASQLLKSE